MTSAEYEIELAVRWRDCDAMGHVNNAVYATYIEQARVDFLEEVVGLDTQGDGLVLASLTIDYLEAIEMDATVTVTLLVQDIGTTSITVSHEIRAGGSLKAEAEARFVHIDREEGTPTPIPDHWLARIEPFAG